MAGNIGKPIDLKRPIIRNKDGTFSTEKTITVERDGRFFNIPTIINGREVSPKLAIESAFQSGQNVGEFDTKREAVESAKKRSQEIGRLRGGELNMADEKKKNDNSDLLKQLLEVEKFKTKIMKEEQNREKIEQERKEFFRPPQQKSGLKTALKVQDDQIKTAGEAGVPTDNILQQLGFEPAKNLFSSAQVTPQGNIQRSGFLANLLGTSTQTLLNQLVQGGKIQQAPLEAQQEQRRLGQEERRIRQEKAGNVRNFGVTVNSQDIQQLEQEGLDLNATIETFGIPARVDPKTGERKYTIPPQSVLSQRAGQQRVTPKEEEYFIDVFDAVDTMQEVLDGLTKIGVTDLGAIGQIQTEGITTELGPFSLPAKFNLIGQFAKDPKFTVLKVKLERAFQKYRKLITGAQASDRELRMLRPLVATFTSRPDVFFQTAKDLIGEGDRVIDTRLDLMESVGRNTTKLRGLVDRRRSRVQDVDAEFKKFQELVGGKDGSQ